MAVTEMSSTYALKRRVTVVGGIVNLLLAFGKVIAGYAGQSQALIADGVHSLSDLVSDTLVLAAARYGSRAPDEDHPYGHARIETAATAGVGALLVLVALGFVYDAGHRLIVSEALWVPGWLAFGVACVSVIVKEALYWYTLRAARRVQSGLIQANAWHHRSDALSSVVVIGGIGGTMLGVYWLDAAAAVVVAVMIGHIGLKLGTSALRELVDTGLGRPHLSLLKRQIDAVSGVRSHHGLRTRRMGSAALADVHICVDSKLSVSEGHRIAEAVREELLRSLEPLTEVLVHVDHESPPAAMRSRQLPVPDRVRAELTQVWGAVPEAAAIESLALHYVGGRVDVDVLMPATAMPTAEGALARRLCEAAKPLGYVGRLRVLYVEQDG
jgi:cation diffusion facilitator family transporter